MYQPLVESEELDAAARAMRRGWLGMGRDVEQFELAIERALDAGTRRAAAVSTGGAALHLAMIVAGVGRGDEVILPSLTHLADVQAVLAVGAHPVLCDIDPVTLCIDPARAAQLVSRRTRAIVAMDYGCHLCDYESVEALARDRGLRVIHDAAHSFGSTSSGRPVGTFSDLCIFSFDPVKALSCIDAGVLMVRTEDELHRVRQLRVLGATSPAENLYGHRRSWHYDATECGYRYHLSNVHAAIGLAQLAKLDQIRRTRQHACARYQERLDGIDGLSVPTTDVATLNPFLYYVRVPAPEREAFRSHLAERSIESGVHWQPVHHLSLARTLRRGPLDVCERVAGEIVSLPLHSGMALDVVDEVCDAVLSYFVSSPARRTNGGTRRRSLAAPLAAAVPNP